MKDAGFVRALVDTGCTQTVAAQRLAHGIQWKLGEVVAVDGTIVPCGKGYLDLGVGGRKLSVQCLVLDSMLKEFDLILGMDVIERLGGVAVSGNRGVTFGTAAVVIARSNVVLAPPDGPGEKIMEVEDVDFSARFDGTRWTARWKWVVDKEPRTHGTVACYAMHDRLTPEFNAEVQKWIDEGILLPVPANVPVKSVVAMMAVEQCNKGNVRPVLDYRELNRYVSSHPGGSAVCDETIRKWRMVGENIALLDLRKAYLQIHVHPDLWKHQVVKFQGQYYYLTRLGFGMNSAPKIMSTVLAKVLSLDKTVSSATDHYIDDILVNEDLMNAGEVAEHLARYGLVTKPAVPIRGAKALGLQVDEDAGGNLIWRRGNRIPEVGDKVSRRELFSVCGQLVGHYPVAGALRVACGYVKRYSGGSSWKDSVGKRTRDMLQELVEKVRRTDFVGGRWCVLSAENGRVWCDASSLALGCALEIDGAIVEDGSWLRKKDDGAHINMAELDSVLKGVNLAAKWKVRNLQVMTDSATVFGWMNSALFDTHKIRTRGMNEMLVKRRLSVMKELCEEFGMKVSVKWVESAANKADELTRVPSSWLEAVRTEPQIDAVCSVSMVRRVHKQHHLGVDRTLYLARLMEPATSRQEVAEVVGNCPRCLSIDPAPVTWDKGELAVKNNWTRLAADVTHYTGQCYLTLVDCGPSRFAVWRRIRGEDAVSIVQEVEQLFRERGPPDELLMDNGASFRSQMMRQMLDKWRVRAVFRCAYRPAGNGIVERHHRTIKRMAARTCGDPLDMVVWYNVTPKIGTDADTVPATELHSYKWRVVNSVDGDAGGGHKSAEGVDETLVNADVTVGDAVFVKPPAARCSSTWPVGIVTRINSATNLEVAGVPRHVADIRAVPGAVDQPTAAVEGIAGPEPVSDRPVRERRPPKRFGNNIYDT